MIELLTAAELAERLKLRPSTIKEWARRGRIPQVVLSPRVRRFDYEAVLRAVKRKRN